MLAHQRRCRQGNAVGAVGYRAERRIVDPAQLEVAVQRLRAVQDGAVVGGIGTDNHLRALPGRRKARRARLVAHRLLTGVNRLHGLLDRRDVFFRGQGLQAQVSWQLDVHAETVGVAAGLFDQRRIGVRDGLEMDVAAKLMHLAQQPGNFDQLLHGVVRGANDPGTQKQPAHAIAAIEVQGQGDHFFGSEARTGHIAGATVDAVLAVVKTEVGQEDFQQRHATPVRRVAVADAHAIGGTEPGLVLRAALGCSTTRARRIVLGGVCQNAELVDKLHEVPLDCLYIQYREACSVTSTARRSCAWRF